MIEQYFRTITRDGIVGPLDRLRDDPKQIHRRPLRPGSYILSTFEDPDFDREKVYREYRLKEIIPAEIFVYEEVTDK